MAQLAAKWKCQWTTLIKATQSVWHCEFQERMTDSRLLHCSKTKNQVVKTAWQWPGPLTVAGQSAEVRIQLIIYRTAGAASARKSVWRTDWLLAISSLACDWTEALQFDFLNSLLQEKNNSISWSENLSSARQLAQLTLHSKSKDVKPMSPNESPTKTISPLSSLARLPRWA